MEAEILDFMLFLFFSSSSEVLLVTQVSQKCCKGLVFCYLLIPMSTPVTEILQPAIRRLLQVLRDHYKEYF